MDEKAQKMLCVMRKHIHDVILQFGYFKLYDHKKGFTINFSKDYNLIPAITEPKYVCGFKFGTKIIKESYYEYYSKISTWRNGRCYEYILPFEEFDKFKLELEEAIENKLFKDLTKMCNEQKEQ